MILLNGQTVPRQPLRVALQEVVSRELRCAEPHARHRNNSDLRLLTKLSIAYQEMYNPWELYERLLNVLHPAAVVVAG